MSSLSRIPNIARRIATIARSRRLALICAAVPALLAGGPAAGHAAADAEFTSAAPACPAVNPPDEMSLATGTPQTAIVGSPFGTALQVTLGNGDGCPLTGVAGTPVTFSAPASGASGVFSGSGTNTITVGSDASGVVLAPVFTANGLGGSYVVTAASQYGSVSFALTNTAAGVPSSLVRVGPADRSATVGERYAQSPAVRVLDAEGDPVAGVSVSFTLGTASATVCGASTAASAAFAGGSSDQATATTAAEGLASSPRLTANGGVGTFAVTAAISGAAGAGAEVGAGAGAGAGAGDGAGGTGEAASGAGAEGSGEAASPGTSRQGGQSVRFTLSNLAGSPSVIQTGLGATQQAARGAGFAIPLAVTVSDAAGDRVSGATVSFSAPRRGPSGTFAAGPGAHGGHRAQPGHAAEVKTSRCGVAVAPRLTAGARAGGFVVEATVGHARPGAFALVVTRGRRRHGRGA